MKYFIELGGAIHFASIIGGAAVGVAFGTALSWANNKLSKWWARTTCRHERLEFIPSQAAPGPTVLGPGLNIIEVQVLVGCPDCGWHRHTVMQFGAVRPVPDAPPGLPIIDSPACPCGASMFRGAQHMSGCPGAPERAA